MVDVAEGSPQTGLNIRQVGAEALDSVWSIIDSCSDYLVGIGHSHWKDYYTKELIEQKLNSRKVYLATLNNEDVGTITLDTNPVDYYSESDLNTFAEPQAEAIYITALAVRPESQNTGFASKLMTFAEEEARQRGIRYIRFDCKASYKELVTFYEKREYKKTGEIIDHQDNDEIYFIMEKEIAST